MTLVLDSEPPTVTLTIPNPAPLEIPLTWHSPDYLHDFDLQYRFDDGSWTAWLNATTNTYATFHRSEGQGHRFRVRVTDIVNKFELGDGGL